MAALLSRKDDLSGAPRGPSALFVSGVRHSNSAAKFWPRLVDEVRRDFPACTEIRLSTALSQPLDRDRLFPLKDFEDQARELAGQDLGTVLRETAAELELLGPPAAVRIELLAGEEVLLGDALPLDCLDAEIFPFLLAWLLEWAGIPEPLWRGELLSGEVRAEDRLRGRLYALAFSVVRRHLSEGLFECTVALLPRVETPE